MAGGGEPDPLDLTGLCLLSLDGGGIRGLSTLYILKGLMTRLNEQRKQAGQPPAKPCDVFDLIGGTSTGGLIAIMLGRLEMDVDECIAAYSRLIEIVFGEKLHRLPVSKKLDIKPQFDSETLAQAIEDIVVSRGVQKDALLNDGVERGCRTLVCTVSKETTGIRRLRSYELPDVTDLPATIIQAGLATSATTSFFQPAKIGAREFVDGALGANNPVDHVEDEASNIWAADTGDVKQLIKCFVSVGTGHPGKKAIEDQLIKFLSKTLKDIATETENTAEKFISRYRGHYDNKRYFRFNVQQGLQDVGLAEYKEQGRIEAATDEYITAQEQRSSIKNCVLNLKQKEFGLKLRMAHAMTEWFRAFDYEQKAEYKNARNAYEQALRTCVRGIGERCYETGVAHRHLARFYDRQGRRKDAVRFYEEALRCAVLALGKRHPVSVASLRTLAISYKGLGEYLKAKHLTEQWLELRL